jgi:hypothetical protein
MVGEEVEVIELVVAIVEAEVALVEVRATIVEVEAEQEVEAAATTTVDIFGI